MRKNKILLLLTMLLLGYSKTNAQSLSPLEYEISEFCKRMEIIYGVIYVDTADVGCDTVFLERYFNKESAERMQSIIGKLEMEYVSFRFERILDSIKYIYISFDSLDAAKTPQPQYTQYELSKSDKSDSLFRTFGNREMQEEDSIFTIEEIEKIMYLLIESSNAEIIGEKNNKAKKRILRIIKIYESQDFYLILYAVNDLRHTYHHWELIIK